MNVYQADKSPNTNFCYQAKFFLCFYTYYEGHYCWFMSGLWSWLYWYFAFEYGIYRCFNILSVLITDVDHITKIKFGTFYILELLDGNHWNPWWQEIGAHPLSWHLDWSLYAKNRGLLSSDKLSFLTYPHIRNEISSTQKHFQHVFFLEDFLFFSILMDSISKFDIVITIVSLRNERGLFNASN